jgi:capsid assembly protease
MPAFKSHSTATIDKTWDGPANEARAKSGQKRGYYGRIFAWFDPRGNEAAKSTYKFIHHEVSDDGTPGPANLTACSAGIAVLNGGRGGANIPAADRQAVHTHLSRHLRDAKKEAPPLQAETSGLQYPALFDQLQDRIWALQLAKLQEVTALVETIMAGEQPFPDAVIGRSGNRAADEPYQVEDGVAVIPVMGTLAKKINLMTDMSGGTSYELLGKQFQAALADPNVIGILLEIDSPGGTADGVKTLADQIMAAREVKPIVAYSDGLMASAAYWLGSAADYVMGSETAMVGSIGVAGTHYDRSGQDEQKGVKRTVISSGKFKRIANDAEPLTAEGKDYLQQMSDTIYQIFLNAVAQNRGETVETVASEMADGREFIGRQALDAGLVDQIGTMAEAKNVARSMAGRKNKGGNVMDLATLKAQHPDIYQEVFDMGVKQAEMDSHSAGFQAGLQEGVDQERRRVTEILQANGDRDISLAAVVDGSDPKTALLLFLEAANSFRANALEKMRQEAPPSLGQAHAGSEVAGDFESKIGELQGQGMSRAGAIRQVAQLYPELHKAYLDRVNPA